MQTNFYCWAIRPGKGVLAEAVAKKLDWIYVNTDYVLEPAIGRSRVPRHIETKWGVYIE